VKIILGLTDLIKNRFSDLTARLYVIRMRKVDGDIRDTEDVVNIHGNIQTRGKTTWDAIRQI
jgi:hypothetical protein